MLNGIINIAAGSDFKNASKPDRNLKNNRLATYQMYEGQDSISISPAYGYLAKHKWKVKELNVEDEKLSMSFTLQGFEFSVVIPLAQLTKLTGVEYKVLAEKIEDGISRRVVANFLVNVSKINYEEKQHGSNFKNIQTFFNRIFHLNLKGEIGPNERKVIDSILEGLAENIQTEFDSINNGLFIFIEKYFKLKLSGLDSKPVTEEKVFVTRIRSFTLEL